MSELEKWFHRDSFSTPEISEKDFLATGEKLERFKTKLYSSPQWQAFKHFSYDIKTIRLNLSLFTEEAIPWVHKLFGDDDPKFDSKSFSDFNKSNRAPVIIGNALHEALSLFDLWRYGQTTPEEIDNSFPTQKIDLILPFIEAMKKSNLGINEVWKSFHTDRRLVDRSRYLLSEEFEELPLSLEKREELEIRSGEKVFNLGLKLSENLLTEFDPTISHSSEALAVFGFEELSHDGGSRIQIPIRIDEIIWEKIGKHHFRYNFFDLKTGKQKLNWPQQFQYLLMEWLAFYSDAFCAFKVPLKDHIKNNTPVNRDLLTYSQKELSLPINKEHIIYNSQSLSEKPKKRNEYKGPTYMLGVSESEVICEQCSKHMTQIVDKVVDLGGPKINFRVQLYCEGHHNSAELIRGIEREALIKPII